MWRNRFVCGISFVPPLLKTHSFFDKIRFFESVFSQILKSSLWKKSGKLHFSQLLPKTRSKGRFKSLKILFSTIHPHVPEGFSTRILKRKIEKNLVLQGVLSFPQFPQGLLLLLLYLFYKSLYLSLAPSAREYERKQNHENRF